MSPTADPARRDTEHQPPFQGAAAGAPARQSTAERLVLSSLTALLGDPLPPVMSVQQLADVLGIGINQTYALLHAGEVSSFRVGRLIRVPTAPVLALLGLCGTETPPHDVTATS